MRRSLLLLVLCLSLFACQANTQEAERAYQAGVKQWNGQGMVPDKAAAVRSFERAAEMGYPPAEVALGFAYVKGEGVKTNVTEALKWFQRAAESGDRDAQYNVGLLFAKGAGGVTKDYAKAVEWFQKAAMQGDRGAQYNLGVMYANGEGSTKDPITAYAWFAVAVHSGDDSAAKDRDEVKKHLDSRQLKQAIRLSQRLRRQIDSGLRHVSSGNETE